ncbi:transcriptional regulator [Kitasatospora cinereorecta]|uniref:Transcriptional regulator n=1 Tax=Kitasatospora cinereorecta TaxID=285560 RepID=A0ABW0V7T1_9ACTN
MYDLATRRHAVDLLTAGLTLSQVSRVTGVSRSALREWTARLEPSPRMTAECPVPSGRLDPAVPRDTYSYLLGLYLGDGCLSEERRGVHALRIACANAWPGLIDECEQAVTAVMPHRRVHRVRAPGCVSVVSRSKHWPCLFPQHGPGPKHRRPVALADWQLPIVDRHPWPLIRGLVHSDGCRLVNRVGRYSYSRYLFTNRSADIVGLYTRALDAVRVEWRSARRADGTVDVSVARRESVALMDARVGPKS